jgi:glycosyltransferase involved in cell wall biosynthesis
MKKKIFTGTFYPLQHGEIVSGRDHYNNKMSLLNDFDIKAFCYNSDKNSFDILKRTKDDMAVQILRFNEKADDLLAIERLFSFWKPDVLNIHGGNSGQKGTGKLLADKYKNDMAIGFEYGGGYDQQTMMQHYYNENVDYIIMNHELWRGFFPKEYQKRIYVTPKQQSVDSKFFIPIDIDKTYDVLFVGRNENKGAELLYELFKNEKNIKLLFKGNNYPDNWKSDNIFTESSEYSHKIIRDIYNSAKIFVIGKPHIMENPYALHMRIITEALSCGLPVVAFKDNFIESNLLYDNHNAFLVDTETEFVEKVKLLLKDKELYKEMSENARLVAISCDISNFMNFYKEMWSMVLNNS